MKDTKNIRDACSIIDCLLVHYSTSGLPVINLWMGSFDLNPPTVEVRVKKTLRGTFHHNKVAEECIF